MRKSELTLLSLFSQLQLYVFHYVNGYCLNM